MIKAVIMSPRYIDIDFSRIFFMFLCNDVHDFMPAFPYIRRSASREKKSAADKKRINKDFLSIFIYLYSKCFS